MGDRCGGLAALLLMAASAYRPVVAIYVYLATLPLIAGIDRNNLIPLVRPNEAMLALVLVGALIGGYVRSCRGVAWPVTLTRVDLALAVFTLLSTVWPLTSLLVRGLTPTPLELASVLPVCKLVVVYLLVRFTVSTDRATVTIIRLIVWPGALIAVIAVMQTLDVATVIRVLHTIYLPEEAVEEIAERGTTTLASPIATGDFIIIALILVICCNVWRVIGARESLVLGTILGTGVLAAGQFSTWIAAVVAGALLLWRFPQLRGRVTRTLPLVGVALIVGSPALITRLEGFSDLGLPVSWLAAGTICRTSSSPLRLRAHHPRRLTQPGAAGARNLAFGNLPGGGVPVFPVDRWTSVARRVRVALSGSPAHRPGYPAADGPPGGMRSRARDRLVVSARADDPRPPSDAPGNRRPNFRPARNHSWTVLCVYGTKWPRRTVDLLVATLPCSSCRC